MIRTAIIVGHTHKDQGAYSPYLRLSTEWQFMRLLADNLQRRSDNNLTPHDIEIFHYDNYSTGYTSRVKRLAKQKINKGNFDLVLELHFNASASPQANGCEALYYFKNKRAKELANHFCKSVSQNLGIKNRGAKALHSKKQRGFAAVYHFAPTTLILEPFFGSNQSDCSKINNWRAQLKYLKIIEELISIYSNESQ